MNYHFLDAALVHPVGQKYRLFTGPRMPVKNKTAGTIGLREPIFDHTVDDLVGDQSPGMHRGNHSRSDGVARVNPLTQHVACGDMRNLEAGGKQLGLSAFSRTRGTEENDCADHVNQQSKGNDQKSKKRSADTRCRRQVQNSKTLLFQFAIFDF
jgi:hypothetical protein